MTLASIVEKFSKTAPIWRSTGGHTLGRSRTNVKCVPIAAPRAANWPGKRLIKIIDTDRFSPGTWRPIGVLGRTSTSADSVRCRSVWPAPSRNTWENVQMGQLTVRRKLRHNATVILFLFQVAWVWRSHQVFLPGPQICSSVCKFLQVVRWPMVIQGWVTWPTPTLPLVMASRQSPDLGERDQVSESFYSTNKVCCQASLSKSRRISASNTFVFSIFKMFWQKKSIILCELHQLKESDDMFSLSWSWKVLGKRVESKIIFLHLISYFRYSK